MMLPTSQVEKTDAIFIVDPGRSERVNAPHAAPTRLLIRTAKRRMIVQSRRSRKREVDLEHPDGNERDEHLQEPGNRPDDGDLRVLQEACRGKHTAEKRPDIGCNRPVGAEPERKQDHEGDRDIDKGNTAGTGRDELHRDPRECGIDENKDEGQDDKGVGRFLCMSHKNSP